MDEQSGDEFLVPIEQRYFEDYVPGASYRFPETIRVSEDEIVVFATAYDPQSFHIDPVAAADGPFQGLIASGWHIASIMMRLYATHYLSTTASLGGPGVDDLRWTAPVRPDDSLSLRTTVLNARRSHSKPDRGLVTTRAELTNQHDHVVFTVSVLNFLKTRSPHATPVSTSSSI